MSFTLRNAVIHPTTPTITVQVFGVAMPAVPRNEFGITAYDTYCPLWPGFEHPYYHAPGNPANVQRYANYPALFADAYSTADNLNDYIGVKAYSLSGGDSLFTGGDKTASIPLIPPRNDLVFGNGIAYDAQYICPSLASTKARPEALVFLQASGSHNVAGWKLALGAAPVLVGLWGPPGSTVGYTGFEIEAAAPHAGSYYVIHTSGAAYGKVLTICTEGAYPNTGGTHYEPGFTDANLPALLGDILNYTDLDSATQTHVPVAIHAVDLGFLITFKKKIAGVWTQKYILVNYAWETFQWINFTAGNAAATAIIAQGAVSPFATSTTLNRTTFVSAYHKSGRWYLSGGSHAAPVVATDNPDDYAIIHVADTNDADVGFFHSSSLHYLSATAVIDGTFFGYIDLTFPIGSGLPDACYDLVTVVQPLKAVTTPLTGDGPDATECLVYDRSVPIPPFQWSLDFPTDLVTGLWHLEGETVSILGDGVVYPQQVVTDGKITVPADVTRCHIGLEFDICVVTLPITTQSAVVEGRRKKVNGLAVRVDKTSGMKIGRNMQELYAMKSSINPYTLAPAEMLTGMTHTLISTNWDDNGQVHFVQRDPLPITLLSIITEVEVGDDPD